MTAHARQAQRILNVAARGREGVTATLHTFTAGVYDTATGTQARTERTDTVRVIALESGNRDLLAALGAAINRQSVVASKTKRYLLPAQRLKIEPTRGSKLTINQKVFSIDDVDAPEIAGTVTAYILTVSSN